MENIQPNVRRGRAALKKVPTRRVWPNGEEQVLIAALRDLVMHGWKTENGFRPGYLNKLEDALKRAYPHTDLVVNPNINSKLTTWKKADGSLVSAQRDTSTTNTLEVTDEQWESVVQKDPTMRGMRHKEWPLFQDWVDIFGKDRATGEAVEDMIDAANATQNQNGWQNVRNEDAFHNDIFVDLDEETFPKSRAKQIH